MQFELAAIDRIFYQSEHLEISSAVARTEHYPVHCHSAQFQVEVVLRGATVCGIGQQRFVIPQHSYSMVNPDVEHYNVTQRWKHALFILFPRHTLDETAWQIYRLWSRPVVFSDVVAPCSPALTTIVHVLFHEAAQPELPGRTLLFDNALIHLSVLLLRALRGNHTAWAVAAGTPRPVWAQIARAVDLMQSCYQDDLSLDDLACLAGLQPAGVICEMMHVDGTMARRPQAVCDHIHSQDAYHCRTGTIPSAPGIVSAYAAHAMAEGQCRDACESHDL